MDDRTVARTDGTGTRSRAGIVDGIDPKGRLGVERLIGADKVKALAESGNRAMQKRIPLAKWWLARMLHWQGRSAADIARTLRVSGVSVRGWLKDRKP